MNNQSLEPKFAALAIEKKIDRKASPIFGERIAAGCSAARLAHWFWEPGVGGSNPLTPTSALAKNIVGV